MLPRRVSSRWPAIMFAASRTARVPGRMMLLMVSIRTMRGISGPGVPAGTRWANMCWVWLIQPKSMNDSHRGSLRASVSARCLVEVKTYGTRPKKLLKTISEKIDTKATVPPGFAGPRRVLNSLWSELISLPQRRDHREGADQKRYGIRARPRKVDSQFREMFSLEERGSKLENRLVIIFRLAFVGRSQLGVAGPDLDF